jgi:hypothetical protein
MSSWMRVPIRNSSAAIFLAALALVLLPLAALGVTALVWHFRTPNRTEYVAKNNEILRRMPRPAGAREIARQVSPKEDSLGEQLSHTVGYWDRRLVRRPTNVFGRRRGIAVQGAARPLARAVMDGRRHAHCLLRSERRYRRTRHHWDEATCRRDKEDVRAHDRPRRRQLRLTATVRRVRSGDIAERWRTPVVSRGSSSGQRSGAAQ